jgi:hypothetical protein
MNLMVRLFYKIKPLIPRKFQISVRRKVAAFKRMRYRHIWPIDPNANRSPEGWKGWPGGKKFAFVLSHDVDTQAGHDSVHRLAEIEMENQLRSSFNFVPERYRLSESLIKDLKILGFQVNVHGLYHDGKLFSSKKIFDKRAVRINHYIEKWGAEGFTSPSMHHNLEWLHALNITHSISTFDTDPFEPQPDPAKTIFPYWVSNGTESGGYLELPYTLPQDHLIFVILREKTIDIWREKVDWIARHGGMVLLNTHTDYMSINGGKLRDETYPVRYYVEFLKYIQSRYADEYFHALPKDISKLWWSQYMQKID